MLDLEPGVLSNVAADVVSGVGMAALITWGAVGLYLTWTKDSVDNQIKNKKQK